MAETYPQHDKDFEKRMTFTGWPTWETESCGGEPNEPVTIEKHQLYGVRRAGGWLWSVQVWILSEWAEYYITHDHEAACLIRNGNRECLEKYANERGWDCLHLSDGCEYYIQMRDLETGEMKLEICKPDIDTAQAAAIDAVMKEKGDD